MHDVTLVYCLRVRSGGDSGGGTKACVPGVDVFRTVGSARQKAVFAEQRADLRHSLPVISKREMPCLSLRHAKNLPSALTSVGIGHSLRKKSRPVKT